MTTKYYHFNKYIVILANNFTTSIDIDNLEK